MFNLIINNMIINLWIIVKLYFYLFIVLMLLRIAKCGNTNEWPTMACLYNGNMPTIIIKHNAIT